MRVGGKGLGGQEAVDKLDEGGGFMTCGDKAGTIGHFSFLPAGMLVNSVYGILYAKLLV